jgi:hypothetical protein
MPPCLWANPQNINEQHPSTCLPTILYPVYQTCLPCPPTQYCLFTSSTLPVRQLNLTCPPTATPTLAVRQPNLASPQVPPCPFHQPNLYLSRNTPLLTCPSTSSTSSSLLCLSPASCACLAAHLCLCVIQCPRVCHLI